MEVVQYEKSATLKECNMKKVQHCRNEIRKKCTEIVHYSAQMDNRPSVDGPLYTGLRVKVLFKMLSKAVMLNMVYIFTNCCLKSLQEVQYTML